MTATSPPLSVFDDVRFVCSDGFVRARGRGFGSGGGIVDNRAFSSRAATDEFFGIILVRAIVEEMLWYV